jgi:hypothetical protein
MANGTVEIRGVIRQFSVKDGLVKIVIEGKPGHGTLDGLVELSFAEVLEVRIRDPQVRLEVVQGAGGFTYPVARDGSGRPAEEPPAADPAGEERPAGSRPSGRPRRPEAVR